ncbi:MAG: 6-bladed beta-propeller [Nitrospiraceae bacterium]|nr:MAG: 6-bladed beta-propeller [Nitrospiraceae bacterium]
MKLRPTTPYSLPPPPSLLLLLVLLAVLLAGCAAPPTKPVGEYFWPPKPETPRIKWLTQWSNRYDFGAPNPIISFFIGEERTETLRRPTSVVADSAGSIYVADGEQGLVFVFDQEKKALRFLGEGILAGPVGVAMDNKRGIVFVSDSRLDKIFGIDKNTGNLLMSIGAPKEFSNPSGMVYDEESERLYVSDTQNHAIRVFDRDGKLLLKFGSRGFEDGEFNFPSYLALDAKGRLFVVDTLNFRVQIFDREGKFINKFGKLGDASGTFTRPYGVGVDSEGHVYVVDSAFNNFQIFEENGGVFLLNIGNAGRKPGEFYLPQGMYIDKQDRIYIADTLNHRVQVFQYLKEQGAGNQETGSKE